MIKFNQRFIIFDRKIPTNIQNPSLIRYKDDEFSKSASELLARNLPLAVLGVVFPRKLTEFFNISIFNTERIDYIARMSLRLMEERKKSSVVYNDFIGVYSPLPYFVTFLCVLKRVSLFSNS